MQKKQKVIGMIIVLIGFLLVGYLVKTMFFKSNDPATADPEQPATEETQPETVNPGDQEPIIAPDGEKVQTRENIARIDNHVSYDMPDGIKERINFEEFDKEFVKYCENNMLLTSKTRAVSDGILEENFEEEYIAFILQLNNYNGTTVTCAIGYDGTYSFSHY